MIDGFKLSENLVQFHEGKLTWEEAIRYAAKPLLDGDYIEESYVDAMIASVKEYGPYIVIAPNMAMPHARPEQGSKKLGFSVTLFEEGIDFGETEDLRARLFVSLSCVDADTHLKMMQSLVMVLGDDEAFNKILNSTDKQELLDLFQ